MSQFSRIGNAIEVLSGAVESRKLLAPLQPWGESERKPEVVKSRVEKSLESFEYYDKTYFSETDYSDGYSQDCVFHELLGDLWMAPGVHIFLGPRAHGKTVKMKKLFSWLVLSGKVKFGATLSSTLPTSRNILSDIVDILESERVKHDFNTSVIEKNADQMTFKVAGQKGIRRIIALSEGRSARGATMGFTRPEFILADDVETRQSTLTSDAVRARIKIIQEAHKSMVSTGSLVVLGNNFDERCAYNVLKLEQEEGLLPSHWHVYSIPAWSENAYVVNLECKIPNANLYKVYRFPKGTLWKNRFKMGSHPSEDKLKLLLKVSDESEWQADFQQNPVPPDGYLFNRRFDYTVDAIPSDARGVIYVDPNLAKKSKGDYTCIIEYLYSAETDYYYIAGIVLRSFSDSNDLLRATISMKSRRDRYIGMDGHVNQESSWTNNIRNYCRISGNPYPPVKYCRYKVDELAKNFQLLWNTGKVMILRSVADTEDGRRFMKQLYAFSGKKANRKDDGPDAVICVNELIHERNLARPRANRKGTSVIHETRF